MDKALSAIRTALLPAKLKVGVESAVGGAVRCRFEARKHQAPAVECRAEQHRAYDEVPRERLGADALTDACKDSTSLLLKSRSNTWPEEDNCAVAGNP